MKQIEYVGKNSISNLSTVLSTYKPRKIFLITGKRSYHVSGAEKAISEIVHIPYTRFFDIQENPRFEDLKAGLEQFSKGTYDMVIGIGGGSVLDMAKLINIYAANPRFLDDIETQAFATAGKPLIAIPTTAGTGSESTHFAVLYKNKRKYSITHELILPTVAIVDPQFTYTLSPKVTATSGMDALAQAIEAYWSIHSNDVSKQYSRKAIIIIRDVLQKVVLESTTSLRDQMVEAAHLSGKAINIAKTTAAHALSYPLTSYFGIPHGEAVAMTLPEIFLYNANVTQDTLNDSRGVSYVKSTILELCSLLGVENSEEAEMYLRTLTHGIGLSSNLSGDISATPIDELIDSVNIGRLNNNPRRLEKEDLMKIFSNIFKL